MGQEIIFWNAPGMGGGGETIMKEGLGGGPDVPMGMGGGPEMPPGIGGGQDMPPDMGGMDISQPLESYTIIIPSEPGKDELAAATAAPSMQEQPTLAQEAESAQRVVETQVVEKSIEAMPESESYPQSEGAASPILGIQPTPDESISPALPDFEPERLPVVQSAWIRRIGAAVLAVTAVVLAALALRGVRRPRQ